MLRLKNKLVTGAKKKIFLCSTNRKCEINFYLENLLGKFLKKNGFDVVERSRNADTIIIMSCGFDEARESRALFVIKHYLDRYLHKKRLVIYGCLTKINPRLKLSADAIKHVTIVGPRELHKFNEIFKSKTPLENISAGKIEKRLRKKEETDLDNDYNVYRVLIGQGCLNNCSFCAIKKAKGGPVSKPIGDVLEELKRGLEQNFRNFVLVADDCGSYGADIGTNFARLLNAINEIKANYRLVIHYLEPARFAALFPQINKTIFKKISKICLPLQSVNRRILGLMNRNYDPQKIFELVKTIKRISPSILVRTHIIFCYPTETKKEFLNNITHPGLQRFDKIRYYCYSKRKGTAAARLSAIKKKERRERVKIIYELSKKDKKVEFPYTRKIQIERGYRYFPPRF